MEFEISDNPDYLVADEHDGEMVKDRTAPCDHASVSPADEPDLKDRALYIPEEEN